MVSLVLSCIGTLGQHPFISMTGSFASAILGTLVSILIEKTDFHEQGFKLWLQQIIHYKEDIRLSFSYIFKIEVDGKYLLIKGNRLRNQYQPIGGVYKYYKEAKSTLDKFHFRPDTKMKNCEDTDDLRIIIKGKYLLKYMKWFLSMEDREYDPTREFSEELLESGLLPETLFKKIKYRKIHIHNEGITYSKYNKCNEYIYSDIFELSLDDVQKDAIRSAIRTYPDKLCLASDDELLSECYNGIEKNIGNNAKWLLGE